MDKIIYQDSNEALTRAIERNGESLTTLIEFDRGVKSAASDLISRNVLEDYRPSNDKIACIHLIAMGDDETYGFNRNGDSFPGKALEKSAHTFVSNGKMYREHRNKDPKKSIGDIKYAAYDGGKGGMHRVELIVHMDKDKAEEEYEMAKKGSALSFSMSCRVPNDRCSICGNEAKNISKYCDHLRNHMGQYDNEMNKYAFAYNDAPVFFDISRVKNPADRIAHHLGYYFSDPKGDIEKAANAMCKAASSDRTGETLVPGAVAAIAEGLHDTFSLAEQNIIVKLAEAEEYNWNLSNTNEIRKSARAAAMYQSYPFSMLSRFDDKELAAARNVKPETLFNGLAKRACILSFPAFAQYLSGMPGVTEAPLFQKAAMILPQVFTRIRAKIFRMTPCTDSFAPCSDYMAERDPGFNDMVQKVMDKAEDKFSVRDEPAQKRVIQIIIKAGSGGNAAEEFKKAASADADEAAAEELAEAYAQYQVSAIDNIKKACGDDAVTDRTYDMIAGANSVMLFNHYDK